jgi:S-adenosylmethionine-diacylgycerolhomoserine-N-methlytransferase
MIADLPVLWRLLRGMPNTGTQQERLEGFYAGQAQGYDNFRERLLQGRAETVAELADSLPETGATLVELGCGTGRNLAFLGAQRQRLWRTWGVDLCPSLLAQARARDWPDVQWVAADATVWRPPQQVDGVLCAYSLTMIPDWFLAIDNAIAMLRPGGTLAVVDFYVPREARLGRVFWPWWFGHDGVHPNADLLPYLRSRLRDVTVTEGRARLPYVPGVRVPWFRIVGKPMK